MTDQIARDFIDFAGVRPPFDGLGAEDLEAVAIEAEALSLARGAVVYHAGQALGAFYVIRRGAIETRAPGAHQSSILGPGEFFGARSLIRTGRADVDATAAEDAEIWAIPARTAQAMFDAHPAVAAFFDRARGLPAEAGRGADPLLSERVGSLMTTAPVTVAPEATVREAAVLLRDHDISCVLVCDGGRLAGILTSGDFADRVVAEGLGPDTPVGVVMTADPVALAPDSMAFDALTLMTERNFVHLPVVEGGRLVGILTSTNLVRRQAVSATFLVGDIARRERFDDFAGIVGRIPAVLAQMVGAGFAPYDIGRILTTVSDALTRRLIAIGLRRFGPPPVPWCWAACGSQGRREQTGVSDQDNCLILGDAYDPAEHGAYFTDLATYVCDGLNAAGYVYCPGDMMATNDRWRQPVEVWRGYFRKWIAKPDEEAQMLASVMFDLRAIDGDAAMLEALQAETLDNARRNSIFRAHMVKNSLKHQPPLGMFRGLALIRSGEHKDSIDMKHAGVVPIVDLARLYALTAALRPVNTRERLVAAMDGKVVSSAGARDLIDAYDLIASVRLAHQARLIREGARPDNFMAPSMLSDLERNHLKDAFQVVKTMQGAASNALSSGA
jgi:CBS domain-containing protein